MRILELKSENVKKIKAIEIKPKSNVVIISGKNGQGKTSVLDSIWFALQGRAGLKRTPMPIRRGEKNAEVKLTLDDFIVTRKWTNNNSNYLKVTNKEGLSYNSPQTLLDSFIGKLSFDPLEFAQLKEEEQREMLMKITGFNADEIDDKIMVLREKRRAQGQQVKLLSGEREETITDREIPEEEISITTLQQEYETATEKNYQIQEIKNLCNITAQKIAEIENALVVERRKLSQLQQELKGRKEINTAIIKNKIIEAEAINKIIRARKRNAIADKKQKEAQKIYDDFTKKIKDLSKEKQDGLKKAWSNMPISGLGLGDTCITYNGIPFKQLSSSEQLKVSLSIAIALNPKLKVIRITDGSLLDDDNMEIIKEIAKEEDFQIWIEKVDGSGKVGFYIEEGEVKNVNR